ncbi:VOC family protein [Actinokineospora sp. NBRC 105648]|uniref:VOC family protein n=1 Tax=Actinokineospora sp. NBRC 105648 TaxID=3032206 RepID=UPI0024A5896F|nr:VOC family protein [Actinokineospora sp. NBRC 105648]GLZ38703.1 chaP protein [Actinokineospora sp. NBRC 105648]
MSIQFNHTIVPAKDKWAAARFLSEVLGLPEPVEAGFFVSVQLHNGVALDYAEPGVDFPPSHLAFLVGEDDFDALYARVRERGIEHWADPRMARPGEINTNDGGRGVYFTDPDGHYLEAITVPYGGWPADHQA